MFFADRACYEKMTYHREWATVGAHSLSKVLKAEKLSIRNKIKCQSFNKHA
jgi:hypothetical protein